MVPSGPIVVIPAYNEEESIGDLLREVEATLPGIRTLVVSDGSADHTAAIAARAGAIVLDLPCNLGVGGAVQAGIRHARYLGYETVVRIDADGQHPPAAIADALRALDGTGADIAIGSRFLKPAEGRVSSTGFRQAGNRALAVFLSRICRCRITDPTSGFWAMRGAVLDYFAHDFPCEYPEPEAIALSRRQGYAIAEFPVAVRPRVHGTSHISSIGTIYFMLRVGLALLADRVRPIDRRFSKKHTKGGISA